MTHTQEDLQAFIREAKAAQERAEAAQRQVELLKAKVEKEEVEKFEALTPEGMLKNAVKLIKNLLREGVEINRCETFYISVEEDEVEISKDLYLEVEAEEVFDEYDKMVELVEAFDEMNEVE